LIAALSAAILSGCIREKDFSLARKGDPIVFGAGSSARGKASVKSSDADTSAGGYYDSVHEFVMDCSDILGNDDEGLRASVASCCGESMENISGKIAPDTKTDYSGVVTGGKERIDWVTGDKIHIIGEGVDPSKTDCSYKVNGVSASGARSSASLSPISADGHGLLWGSGNADFLAVYPGDQPSKVSLIGTGLSSKVSVSLENGLTTNGYQKVTAVPQSGGSILWKPDMGYAAMMAVTRDVSPTAAAVPLGFLPLVTTVDVTLSNPSSKKLNLFCVELECENTAVENFRVTAPSSGSLSLHSSLVAESLSSTPKSSVGVYADAHGSGTPGSIPPQVSLLPNSGNSLTVRLLCSPVNDLKLKELMILFTPEGEYYPVQRRLRLLKSDKSPVTLSKFGKHNIKVSLTGRSGYVLEVVPVNGGVANPITYNGGTASFTVKSYRKRVSEDGTVTPAEAAPWHIIGYEESYDGVHFRKRTTTLPSWITGLITSGPGSTGSTESLFATFSSNNSTVDLRALLNADLKNAPAKGSIGSPYNLSNQTDGGNTIENTANCYLISAPGYYKLPLVYGNAIKNGIHNQSSYKNRNYVPGLNVLKDHMEHDITNPYINVQSTGHGGREVSSAYIVWADAADIVDNLQLEGSGANAFLKFCVSADKICNGNAVVAIKDTDGIVMWSWHLWFDREDALETIPVKSGPVIYKFSRRNLGNVWKKWEGSSDRYMRITVSQDSPAGNINTVVLRQNKGSVSVVRECLNTYYQWGRKDAFPFTDSPIVNATINGWVKNGGNNMSIRNGIQHPGTFYPWGDSWTSNYLWLTYWSMENKTTGFNHNAVIKTVYDPCPVDFHLPASYAFGMASTTGDSFGMINSDAPWNWGYDFKTGMSGEQTIYFPSSGTRDRNTGDLYDVGNAGEYWSAIPFNSASGCYLLFNRAPYVDPKHVQPRSGGLSIRPVSD